MRIGIDYSAAVNQRAGIGRYARGVLGALAAAGARDWALGVAPRPNRTAYDGPRPYFARGRAVELPLSERLLWAAWYRARLVMAVSENTKSDVVRLLGVPPGRVRVAPNAPDPLFRPCADEGWRTAERARLGLPRRFLLAVGTLEPRKNLIRLLDALALLRDRGAFAGWEGPPLVVAGREGWLYEPIYACVDSLGLRGQVRFMTGARDLDLLALYNLAGALVYPSLYEGFGLPPLEALACGAVVVCSNSSALPEVVGDAALLVDPYDVDGLAEAIARALDDEPLRRELGARGPGQARRYSWEASAASVRAALREAAS